MSRIPLDVIDAASAEQSHYSLVAPSQLEPGGIDPLGMGAVNLGLAVSALPGINNVTSRIRVYSFLAWAWWRARKCFLERGAGKVDAKELQALVDRWEVLFIWSNMLHETNDGLPGRLKLGGALPKSGIYVMAGEQWDKLRAARHSGQTSLQAAVTYGPSTKALQWIVPREHGAFVPTEQVMGAVQAFEAAVAPAIPSRLLQPGAVEVSLDEVRAMHKAWNAEAITDAERDVFKEAFYSRGIGNEVGEHTMRARTIEVFRRALAQADCPCRLADVRRILASWRFADGRAFEPGPDIQDRAVLWPAFQARQLQRLSLEAMLCWLEDFIAKAGGVAPAEAMAAAADEAARVEEEGADAGSVGSYLNEAASRGTDEGWPRSCAWHAPTDIFDLMDSLSTSVRQEQWERVPGLALRGIAFAEAVASGVRALGPVPGIANPLGGAADRLPLSEASRQLRALKTQSMSALWKEIILSWVLAQHVRWSVARNGDGKQRLRVTLDEGGWTRLRTGSRSVALMPDRIGTALSLGAECGLFSAARDGAEERLFSTP
jgi:hypothetical protein